MVKVIKDRENLDCSTRETTYIEDKSSNINNWLSITDHRGQKAMSGMAYSKYWKKTWPPRIISSQNSFKSKGDIKRFPDFKKQRTCCWQIYLTINTKVVYAKSNLPQAVIWIPPPKEYGFKKFYNSKRRISHILSLLLTDFQRQLYETICISLFCWACKYGTWIHSTVAAQRKCFRAIINNAVLNSHVLVFLRAYVFMSLKCLPRSRVAVFYGELNV